MDWKRVKSILIGMLLLTNLILAASIYSEFTAEARAERQAVRSAIELVGDRLVIDESAILALPPEIYAMSVTRSSELEMVFAQGLLGGGTSSESGGGGIYRFESAAGRGEIKRGGELSFSIDGEGLPVTAEFFANILAQTGLQTPRPVNASNGRVTFEQNYEGLPVLDYVLECTQNDVSGRWLISDSWVRLAAAPTRAELVVRLAGLALEWEINRIDSISCAYFVENTGGQDSAALPVWIISAAGRTFIYDLVGGRVVDR